MQLQKFLYISCNLLLAFSPTRSDFYSNSPHFCNNNNNQSARSFEKIFFNKKHPKVEINNMQSYLFQ